MATVIRRYAMVGPSDADLALNVDPSAVVNVQYPTTVVDITVNSDPGIIQTLDDYMGNFGLVYSPGTPASDDTTLLTNNEATPLVVATPVYSDAPGGAKRAKADAFGTAKLAGLASEVIAPGVIGDVVTVGPVTFTTGEWDVVTGDVGGLVFNEQYWLSDVTAGRLIRTTAPGAPGSFDVYVGYAVSSTTMILGIQPPIGPL